MSPLLWAAPTNANPSMNLEFTAPPSGLVFMGFEDVQSEILDPIASNRIAYKTTP